MFGINFFKKTFKLSFSSVLLMFLSGMVEIPRLQAKKTFTKQSAKAAV
jgi:hypothetical protein